MTFTAIWSIGMLACLIRTVALAIGTRGELREIVADVMPVLSQYMNKNVALFLLAFVLTLVIALAVILWPLVVVRTTINWFKDRRRCND